MGRGLGIQASDQGARLSIRSYARDILQYGSSTIGLVALVLYAAVRISYNTFYAKFGLRPEEVGITYLSILVPVAEVAFLVGTAFVVFAAQLIWWPAPRSAARYFWRRPGGRMAVGGAIWLAASVAGAFIYQVYPLEQSQSLPFSAFRWGLAAFGLWFLLSGLVGLLAVERAANSDVTSERYRAGNLIVVTGVFIAVSTALGYLSAYAEFTAEGVIAGRGVAPSSLGFVSFQASPVCVDWIGSDQPSSLDLTDRMFYLGTADGIAVLYSPGSPPESSARSHAPVRLPLSKVVLLPATANASCTG